MSENKIEVTVPTGIIPPKKEDLIFNHSLAVRYLDYTFLNNVLGHNIFTILENIDCYFQTRSQPSIFKRTDYQIQTKEIPDIAGSGDSVFNGHRDISTETLVINKINKKAILIKNTASKPMILISFQPSVVEGNNGIFSVGVPEIVCEAEVNIFMFPAFVGQVYNYLDLGIIDTDFTFSKPAYH